MRVGGAGGLWLGQGTGLSCPILEAARPAGAGHPHQSHSRDGTGRFPPRHSAVAVPQRPGLVAAQPSLCQG